MTETKHQIILIRGPLTDDENIYARSPAFIESVGQWDEVTDDELKILMNVSHRHNFHIVERNPVNLQPSFRGLRTPRDYIKEYRKQEAEQKEKRQQRQQMDSEKLKKKKLKQLARLKAELGET